MTVPSAAAEETFLPWLRRGLGVGIGRAGAGAENGRASLRVAVELERRVEARGGTDAVDTQRAVVTLPMFGPADVTGLEPRAIVRMWPQPDVGDAEAEYLPLVDLAEPDLPWRYTPAGDADGRLRPWLCLVAFEEGEFTLLPSGQERPRTEFRVRGGVALPNLADAWAWAHVHVTDALALDASGDDPLSAAVLSLSERAPSRVVARLLCARRLAARKRYTAALVPTFNAAGTGDAWAGSAAPADGLTLPVFHHWSFGTGPEGDFETLARRLTMCTSLPADVGRRAVDLRAAAPRLRAVRGGRPVDSLQLGAALEPVRVPEPRPEAPTELDAGDDTARSLAALLDALTPTLLQRDAAPLVGPPAYGCWYLPWQNLPPRLPDAGGAAPWLASLNLDVAHRIAAGVATRVVQEQQQALMASAWAQLGSLRRVDEERRFAQVSREAARRVYRRDVTRMSTEALLRFTAPVHARVMAGARTVRAALDASPVDPAVLTAAWRRVARPRGPLGRRQQRDATTPPLLDRMNRGELAARSPARPEALTTSIDLLDAQGEARKAVLRAAEGTSVLGQLLLCVRPARGAAARLQAEADEGVAPRTPGALAEAIRTGGGDDAMRAALVELAGFLGGPPTPTPPTVPVDLAALAATVKDALDPSRTIPEGFRARLTLRGERVRASGDDPLGPVVAYPEFAQPMYEPLRDLSPEWILPGLDRVPRNTVSLLRPNRAFVEAYLVGLNHEMARELLWHTYPTDQRGTYFRRFWRSVAPEPGATARMDIAEIHRWPRATALGGHPAAGAGEDTVFLVRGDLVQRFPTAIFSAVRDPDGPSPEEVFPVFVGSMKPDVIFVGLPLSTAALRGSNWYFAIQEPVTETRFHHRGAGAPGTYATATQATAAEVAAALAHTPVRLLLEAASFLEGPAPEAPALGAGEAAS